MKSLMQYLVALVLVLLGIALLWNPSHPAQISSDVRPGQADSSRGIGRPAPGSLMRLA
jgi:hypothetical protein